MSVLVLFVDALGPAMLARLQRRLPWLCHSRELRGELGYSSGALATILTGEAPAAHGRLCLFSAHQGDGDGPLTPLRWLGLLPSLLHERGALRRAAARFYSAWRGWSGYFALHRVPPEVFSWLDAPEREDLFQASEIGGVPTFLARARRRGLRVVSARWQLGEAARWGEVLGVLGEQEADLIFLYSAELDGILHAEGSHGAGVEAALDRLAERADRARGLALRRGPVTTVLVGDHGMADVHSLIDPRSAGFSGRVFVDSTMARFWGNERELSRARCRTERWPGRWLDRSALQELGVQGETARAPFGDAMFVLDEGYLLAPSFVGGAARGMHGYFPGAPSSVASVASDSLLPELTSLRGIAPFLLKCMENP